MMDMPKSIAKLTVMTALAASMLAPFANFADAAPAGLARNVRPSAPPSYIVERRPTMPPFAFIQFCAANASECQARGGKPMVEMTPALRDELKRINGRVNASIRAVNDEPGNDIWQIGVSSGDCEDFALTKRQKLVTAGWSPRALRMVVARTREGEGHAVLVVKTSEGDMVLDNRTNEIRPWNRAGLRGVKIQSGDNPRLWRDL
jgi:predicted transglutaminase-like cysteine proteinase